MDITLWIELTLFVCLMALSGFFSSSETSLFSLSKIQLEQMRRDGHAGLNRIERLLSQPRRLIVTILIGNEFVNVAASVISAVQVPAGVFPVPHRQHWCVPAGAGPGMLRRG